MRIVIAWGIRLNVYYYHETYNDLRANLRHGDLLFIGGAKRMPEETVIIAHRRKGSDYWEGYSERTVAEADSWVAYFHSLGQIVKVFHGLGEFRADCNKLLDRWEERQRRKNNKQRG